MANSKNHKFDLRIHLVRYALDHGLHTATRQYQCSRNTVRKWVRRYQAEGLPGLEDRSRAPKSCPHKTPKAVERRVLAQRRKTPGFGARRLKREFELTPSVGAIARIIRQNGLSRRRKKKRQVKRDLRAVKARYKPLTRFQMDVKYLNDIPQYFPFMTGLGLPRFQYTTRCLKTGATFLAYGNELSLTYAELTARRLLAHLKTHGIDLTDVVVQTDRGSEFDGQAVNKTETGFTHTIEKIFGAHHRLLVKANPNANADVESFHAHEETEFFDIESFIRPQDFWQKITTYQHYWNLGRPNSYKNDQTPLEILTDADPNIPAQVLLLPPADLDTLIEHQGGHHLPVLTESGKWMVEVRFCGWVLSACGSAEC
jgi:transposase